MKKLMWTAIAAVAIQQIAKYFGIKSFRDVKELAKDSYKGLKRFAVNPS